MAKNLNYLYEGQGHMEGQGEKNARLLRLINEICQSFENIRLNNAPVFHFLGKETSSLC